jgi:hypothetical protein
MAEADWFTPLSEFLHAISSSVNEALASGTHDLRLIQYGDSVTFSHDDVEALISVGTSLQVTLFRRDILAQFGLSGGGAYYLDDTGIHRIVDGLRNIKLHCVVGRGLARSHLVLRGIKGPRFMIDDEMGHVPVKGRCWEKVVLGLKVDGAPPCSELRWWKDVPDILEVTVGRIRAIHSAIECEKAEMGEFPHMKSDIERKIASLSKRLEHYECFCEVLEKEPGW